MQFNVPKFIEVEDKLIGPLTLKQSLYLGAGAGLMVILWFILRLGAFIIASAIILGISALFAFYKVNGRSLTSFLISFVHFLSRPKLYLWKKEIKKQ